MTLNVAIFQTSPQIGRVHAAEIRRGRKRNRLTRLQCVILPSGTRGRRVHNPSAVKCSLSIEDESTGWSIFKTPGMNTKTCCPHLGFTGRYLDQAGSFLKRMHDL